MWGGGGGERGRTGAVGLIPYTYNDLQFLIHTVGSRAVPSGTRLCVSCSSRAPLAGNGECGKVLTFFPGVRTVCVWRPVDSVGFFGLGHLRATSGFVSTVPEIVYLVIKSLGRHRDQQCQCCSVRPRSTYLLLVGASRFQRKSRNSVSKAFHGCFR